MFFQLSTSSLTVHEYKLYKRKFNTDIGKFSFSNRVVDAWNKLPSDIMSCDTVACFKIQLDLLFKEVWWLI